MEQQIKNLRIELREHNHNYYVLDKATISDYDFDIKLKTLQELEAKHPEFFDANSPTQRVGGAVTKNFETIVHEHRMYSLENSYSKEDLQDWETRIKKLVDGDIKYTCDCCTRGFEYPNIFGLCACWCNNCGRKQKDCKYTCSD